MPIKPQGPYFTNRYRKINEEVESVRKSQTVLGTSNGTPLIWVSNEDLRKDISKFMHELEFTYSRDNSIRSKTKLKYLHFIEECKLWLKDINYWEEKNRATM
ncbi:hypothetical protein [Litchfieldia alkalitelluris]|uniref:hypothetical protein n=1 Tax=Litchfieldia alkalitelluris TaxID=304268 RepID=UPI0009970744|nr:hypothetical protein [Litchfieldia alkalitelluris]